MNEDADRLFIQITRLERRIALLEAENKTLVAQAVKQAKKYTDRAVTNVVEATGDVLREELDDQNKQRESVRDMAAGQGRLAGEYLRSLSFRWAAGE